MIHNYITADDSGRHYGVSTNEKYVLIQVDNGYRQAREHISSTEALAKAKAIETHLLDGFPVFIDAREGDLHVSIPLTTEQAIHVIRLIRQNAVTLSASSNPNQTS